MKRENIQPDTKLQWIVYICLFFVSVIFMTLFARATSPLYEYYGTDSPIFITMANALLDGKTLYVDHFDHKGPVLFFIEALGQLICKGRTGMFVLEIISFFFVLVLLYKTALIFTHSLRNIVTVIVSFLFLFSLTIEEGNQTEELSMLFIFASVYITLRYYYKKYTLAISDILWLGVCFSTVFWIRPNNAGVICACIAFIFLVNVGKKNWIFTAKYTFLLLLVFLLYSALVSGYFMCKDAFDEMIFASFTFNFKYMKYEFGYNMKSLLLSFSFNILILASIITAAYINYKKEKDFNVVLLLISLLAFGFIPVNMIKIGMFQYKSLLIPIFFIAILLFYKTKRLSIGFNKLQTIGVVLLLFAMSGIFIIQYNRYKNFDSDYLRSAREMVTVIPTDEYPQVFGYQIDAKIFLMIDLKPTYKYFIFQEFHGSHDGDVIQEVNNMLQKDTPLWVFTQRNLMRKSTNIVAVKLLEERYDIAFEDNNLILYHLKTNNNKLH